MPGLQVQNLVKKLGDRVAVDDLSFSVEPGEFFVLLGPSGCGKTTTLRIVCGLEQPDSGRVLIGDRDVTSQPPRSRNLGMVFQEYGLYPSMDVHGNLAYGLQARGGLDKSEIERRINEVAESLDLTPLLRLPITDLSGGEQQRVALGRAMVKDADAYLFDEPLSNLDPKLRYRVRRDIIRLHREREQPSVYVTHDQTEAFAMGDVVAVMANGRIQQVGPPQALLDEPASVFVARFVGSPPMNLLDGQLRQVNGEYVAQVRGTAIPLPVRMNPALGAYDKDAVTVGIRPDGLRIKPASAVNGSTVPVVAEITEVEALIGETVVRLQTGDDTTLAAVLRDGSVDALRPGDAVHVEVDPDGVRLFDPQSERALAT